MFYLIKNPEERFSCCEIWADTEAGHGVRTPPPPGISQVAVGFLTNIGTDLPQEAIGPFLKKQLDHLGPIASWGRSVRPSVKHVIT